MYEVEQALLKLEKKVFFLGPLEYVLNTPSHHRVHHGRNPYCIDKNYAGALIIWDRIFGKSKKSFIYYDLAALRFVLSLAMVKEIRTKSIS